MTTGIRSKPTDWRASLEGVGLEIEKNEQTAQVEKEVIDVLKSNLLHLDQRNY